MEQKKERTKLPSRFFLPVMASSTKVDALKTLQYYDKKKLPDLQDNSYKKTSIQLFNEYMLSYSWEDEACPWCGSKGNCVSHGSYMRSMADFMYGKTVYGEICVLRLCCTSCGHTHAILPDVIIPYSVYGLFFILRVLAEYFLPLHTVEKLCTRFGISVSMLYRWRDLFLSHKQEWLGMLVSAETVPSAFIKGLCFLEQYSISFACQFVLLSARSFLQSHRNPADYRQEIF